MMGDVRLTMHHTPNPVSAVLADHAATLAPRQLLDRCPDVVEARSGAHAADARVQAAPRDADDVKRVGRALPNHEGPRRVAMKATDLGGDVDVDDRALAQATIGRGH